MLYIFERIKTCYTTCQLHIYRGCTDCSWTGTWIGPWKPHQQPERASYTNAKHGRLALEETVMELAMNVTETAPVETTLKTNLRFLHWF